MHAKAARAYKKVDLQSSSKTKVLDRLYGRLLADIEEACVAIDQEKVEARASAVDHAIRIVTELNAALDFRQAPDLCANLAALYGYVIDRLEAANLTRDIGALREASAVIDNLRESFQIAADHK